MDRENQRYIQRQIRQLHRQNKIDEAAQQALLNDLEALDAALERAQDRLSVFHELKGLGFKVVFDESKPYQLQVILPSGGQLPVNLALPKDDGPIKYANKQRLLGIF